ncbi:MAG: PAS domain S-box protein [Candidatus Saccharicenans sp.]|nr:PAS domain S-box protein [Candidatus Saccharicenans sp.]
MRSLRVLWPKWKKRLKSPIYLSSVILIVIIILVGLSLRNKEEEAVKKITYQELSSIAELKARQIRQWLDERKGDARVMTESPYFAASLLDLLKKPDPEGLEKIRDHLALTVQTYGYMRIIILNEKKEPVITYGAEPPARLIEILIDYINRAEKYGTVVNTDLHASPDEKIIHIDFISPVFRPGDPEKRAGAIVILTVNAEDFLFPLIQTWPVASETAETALVKREGEEVVFLNELRHRQDTALKLRFPLSRKEIPAVRAALGEYGNFEGIDYRGQAVMAYLTPVPNTCWSIVSKIDKSEALSAWYKRSLLIILFMTSLIIVQLTLTELFWQRREKVSFQQLYEAEARARETEQMFQVLSDSSMAGVYLVQDGVFKYVNRALAEMFGYTPDELIGKLGNLDLTHPEDRPMVQENNRRRLSGEVTSLRFEFRGLRKDGSFFYCEAHGSSIEYRGRKAIIGTLIDITDRVELIQELLAREAEIRATLYSIGDAVISTDSSGHIMMMNPVAEKLTGWKEDEARGRPVQEVFNIVNEFTREPAPNPVERVLSEGIIVGLANHTLLISKDGRKIPVADSGAPIIDSDGENLGVILVFRDQTAEREAQNQILQAREELREKNRFLENLITSLPGMVYRCRNDRNWTMEYIAGTCKEITGYEPEDLIENKKISYNDLIVPEHREYLWKKWQRILSRRGVFEDEYQIRTAEGSLRWVWERGSGVFDRWGNLVCLEGFISDITEKKKAEEELIRSEREKSAIFATISEHVIYQATDHTIVWANRAAAESLGLKPEELKGRKCYELWHGRKEPCQICPVAIARETGEPNKKEVQSPDGRWWEISGYPMKDEAGKIIGLIEVTAEITARKRAEQALKESEARFRRLAENARDLIYRYRFGVDRGFEYVSPAATSITGYTPEDHYADPDLGFKIILEEDRPILEQVAAGQVGQPVVLRWRKKDGTIIWTEQINVPIYDESGQLVAIEGIARDITERKLAEEALKQSLREKEILIREIHHRVKNNMQVISSILNLQSALLDDPKAKAAFKECQYRIKSMAMVHERLYRAKDLTSIDFSDYLNNMARNIFLDQQVNPEQVQLHLDIQPMNLNINTAVPLGLIMNELITNAFKHAFPGGRRGNLWVSLKRTKKDRARLVVKDDGVGFPKGLDFKKSESLGMVIVNTLVDQIDGQLELVRGESGGSEFHLTFPC